jgi:hypothetical protein
MAASDRLPVAWHVSSYSASGGSNCVEAGPVLDSHHPDGPVIIYTRAEWDAFLAGVRNNEFDFPA